MLQIDSLNQLIANAVMLEVHMYITRRKAPSLERTHIQKKKKKSTPWQAVESIRCIHINQDFQLI